MSSGADPSTGRRHRTLLITDIVSSTEHLARLGDARWRELLERHGAEVKQRASDAGGQVLSDRGDGFLIAFEDPEAGVRCAENVCLDTAELGISLRAGLHAGECELLGDQLAGMAIHIAARVSGLARADEVLVTEAVRELVSTGGLEFGDRGLHELRGVPGTWRIWALRSKALESAVSESRVHDLRVPPLPLPPSASARIGESKLANRTDELEHGLAAFERVRTGERRTLLIAGEPGIGKTRLAAELAARLQMSGATVLWGRCDPELGIPYQPFVELLTHYARFVSADVLAQHRSQFGHELARLVPELGGSAVLHAPAPEQSAEENRHVMFAAVHGLLRTAALQRPLAIVIDDLQWADRETLLMLRYVLVSSEPVPALVIGTYTASQMSAHHGLGDLLVELGRDPTVERIVLEGLASGHVIELARELSQEELDGAAVQLLQTLSEQTGGNPFFLREILRGLRDSGGIAHAARVRAANESSSPPWVTSSIRETIIARVARLGERAEHVLCAAAVAGREFDADLVARMLEVDEDELAQVLDAAVDAALIDEVPAIGLRYSFMHSLIHPALYEQLGAARRRVLHRRALEALEQLLGGEARRDRIGELAGHALGAVPMVDVVKAADYLRQAGEHALEQLAPREATRWFVRGLELQGSASGRAGSDELRCDLLIGRGIAERQCGDASFRDTLLEACTIARELGDSARMIRGAVANTRGFVSETGKVDTDRVAMLEAALEAVGAADSPERARLLAVLSSELTFAGDWARRKGLSDESVAIARRLGDPTLVGDVLSLRFITVWTPETLDERLADTERGLAIAEESGNQLALLRALHWRAAAAVEAGQLQLAGQLVTRQTELAGRLREPTYSWLAAYDRATQALMTGLLEEAERSAEDARVIATDSGQPEALAFYAGQLINIRFEQGRLEELEPLIAVQVETNPGIPAFRGALALARAEAGMHEQALEVLAVDAELDFSGLPYDSNWLAGMAIYAEACALLDDRRAAAALHELLAPWIDHVAFNSATTWGLVERHVGNLERVLGRYEEAEQSLRRAAERHAAMGAPLWRARTRLDLARVLLERGVDSEEATQLLEQAARTAAELGCASVQRRSEELLARVREPA
jgi:class 3 adenylate cyclase/tetratricopeptide (TPR) repeat protein